MPTECKIEGNNTNIFSNKIKGRKKAAKDLTRSVHDKKEKKKLSLPDQCLKSF